MAATVVITKRWLVRHAKRDRRFMSASPLIKKLEIPKTQTSGGDHVDEPHEDGPCWVPHPRTGIYYPRGHEGVVDDIPEGASSLSQAFWLRSVDGVDKPDPDELTHHGSASSK